MTWYLSPSGWPTWADDDDTVQALTARGYDSISEAEVQAAVDAYMAAAPPPSTQLPGYALAVDVAAGLAGKLSITDIGVSASEGGTALRAALVRRRPIVVAANGWAGGGASGTQTNAGTGEKVHTIGVDCSDLQLVYSNFLASSSADADGPSAYPIKAAIRLGASAIYRHPLRGSATVDLAPGAVTIGDPLAVECAAGDNIHSRTYINHTAWRPNTASFGNSGGFTNATDLTEPGAAAISYGVKWMFAPSAVLGIPKDPDARAFGVIGDSIAAGTSDANPYGGSEWNGGKGGFISRGLFGKAGWVNVGVASDSGYSFLASHHRRMALFDYVTDMICQYGTNDVYNADHDLATLQADWIALWQLGTRRGLRVYQTTLAPRTTDTAGLTPFADGKETIRVAANDWLRAGAPIDSATLVAVAAGTSGALLAGEPRHPLTGYLELADSLETARNSGVWNSGYTQDGVHPDAEGCAPAGAALSLQLFGV